MYVCMYVCMYVYIYKYIYVYIYIYIYIYIHNICETAHGAAGSLSRPEASLVVSISLSLYISIYIYISLSIYIYMCMPTRVCPYIHTRIIQEGVCLDGDLADFLRREIPDFLADCYCYYYYVLLVLLLLLLLLLRITSITILYY